jgi:HEAT repeat protein
VLGSAALLLVCTAMVLLVERRPADPGQPQKPQTPATAASSASEQPAAEARIIRPEQPTEVDRPAPRLPRRLGGDIRRPEAAPDRAPPPAAEPVPARLPAEVVRLIEALAHQDPAVRLRAAKQLGERGRAAHWAVPELSKALRDRFPDVRRQAGKALAAVGAAAVPELVQALRERDVAVRARAARSLALIGPEAREAVETLTAGLRDADPSVRAASVLALGEIGPAAKPAVPGLVKALGDANDMVRGLALEALRAIGPGATESLGKTLAKGQPKERLASVRALGLLGPDAREAMPQLRDAMRNGDKQVRAATAQTLGRMGTEAREAVPELLDALQSKDLRTQVPAAVTLVGLAESGVPGVLEKIREADRKGRWAEPLVRKRFGAARPETVLKLKKELEAEEPLRRLQAVLGLGQLASRSRAAADALKQALRDQDPHVQLAAAQALLDAGAPAVQGLDLKQVEEEARRRVAAFKEVHRAAMAAAKQAVLRQRLPAIFRAMNDPTVQARLDRFIALYVVIKGKRVIQGVEGRWRPRPVAPDFGSMLDAILERLGPEAIPALVKGINTTVGYKVGFC